MAKAQVAAEPPELSEAPSQPAETSSVAKLSAAEPAAAVKTLVPQVSVQPQDLAAAVRFGLQHGVSVAFENDAVAAEAISSQRFQLNAAAEWLQLLQRLLKPSSQLISLAATLEQETPITRATWEVQVEQLQLWGFRGDSEWKVCAGNLHEYPCGLWQLFHAITVASTDSSAVSDLQQISRFVALFFLCIPCQEHFAEAVKTMESQVVDRRSAILWLWRTHNSVSVRLAADTAEKSAVVETALYPTVATCPSCREPTTGPTVEWDEQRVVLFLEETYSLAQWSETGDNSWSLMQWLLAILAGGAACYYAKRMLTKWQQKGRKEQRQHESETRSMLDDFDIDLDIEEASQLGIRRQASSENKLAQ